MASAEWVERSGGSWEWVEADGTKTGRFVNAGHLQEMEQRAAAGAVNGGGQVPKGLSEKIVKEGEERWQELLNEADTNSTSSKWAQLKASTLESMSRTRVLPLLSKLGDVALGATSFQLGWEIGGGEGTIIDFFFGGKEEGVASPPENTVLEANQLLPFAKGQTVEPLGGPKAPKNLMELETKFSTSASTYTGPFRPESYSGVGGLCEGSTGLIAHGAVGGIFGEPPGAEPLGWPEGGSCTEKETGKKISFPLFVVVYPPNVTCLPKQNTNGCPHKVKETRHSGAVEPLEGAALTAAMHECFTDPACSPFAAWWYNHEPGHSGWEGGEEGLDPSSPVETRIPAPEKGELYPHFDKRLEELELVPKPKEVSEEEIDSTKPPKTIVYTKPHVGKSVEPKTVVEVLYNGAVVPAPNPNENYEAFNERLAELGLTPHDQVLGETAIDTSVGPNDVSATEPAAGTKVKNGSTVEVRYNPPDAPPVVAGGGGGCNTSVGSVDFTPLNQPLGSKFPFGIFGFFVGWIGEWSATSTAPKWTVTLLPSGVFGSKGIHLPIDLASLAAVAEVVRVAFLFASFVGLLWFLGTAAARIQGDGS